MADMTSSKLLEKEVNAAGPHRNGRGIAYWSVKSLRMLYPTLGIAAIVLLWVVISWLEVIPHFIVPPPDAVIRRMMSETSELLRHSRVTLVQAFGGFVLAVGVGIPLSVLLCYSTLMHRIVYPLLVGSQTMPKVAVAPLLLVWFGFGMAPKVIIAFLLAIFPIVIASVVGLRSMSPALLQLARSFGASKLQIFTRFQFPNALPTIFGGLKVGATLSVIGAVVGEFVGANSGLGYVVQVANGRLDLPLLFSALIALSGIGILLFCAVGLAEMLFLPRHRRRDLQAF